MYIKISYDRVESSWYSVSTATLVKYDGVVIKSSKLSNVAPNKYLSTEAQR